MSAFLAGASLALVTPGPALAVAVLVAAVPLAFAAGHRSSVARASAGIRAEDATAAAAARCPVDAVVHGPSPDGRGDVDHVLLGPCLVAVETKYGRGRVSVEGSKVRVGGRLLPRDPVGQAREAARKIERFAGSGCDAVLVVSGMVGRPFVSGGVTVCPPSDLAGVVSSLPARLSSRQAQAIARRLDARRD